MSSLAAETERVLAGRSNEVVHDGSQRMSGEALAAWARGIATQLRQHSGGEAKRVIIAEENSCAAVAAHLGCLWAGVTAVPINPAATAAEIKRIEDRTHPILALAPAALTTVFSVDALDVREVQPTASACPWDLNDPKVMQILFTSGSSGVPKGVEVHTSGVAFCIHAWCDRMFWSEKEVTLCVLPLFHVMANVLVLYATVLRGGRMVLRSKTELVDVVQTIGTESVTFLPAVPPMLVGMTLLPISPSKQDFSSLRLVLSAGAPLPVDAFGKLEKKLGDVLVIDAYGVTELSPLISGGPIDKPHRMGSVGKAYDGVDIAIFDPNTLAPCPTGSSGEICAKSPGVMGGYLDDPEATAAAMHDGWYRTGDLGYLDEDGYLFISGRIRDMVIVNGMNVFPREVENALLDIPGVNDAAVKGEPDRVFGERVEAYLISDGPLPEEALVKALKESLSEYKVPKVFHFVDVIPRTASGKVRRHLLKA